VELFLVENDSGVFLLPVVNDQFVLNYELGLISNFSQIQNDIKILQKYEQDQVKSIA
jgi:hypothetical protein